MTKERIGLISHSHVTLRRGSITNSCSSVEESVGLSRLGAVKWLSSLHFFIWGSSRPPHHNGHSICLERNFRRPVSQVMSKRDERMLQFETFTLLSYYTETFPFHSYNAKPLLLLSYHFGTLEFLSFNDVTLLLTYNIAWVSFFITVSEVVTKAVMENIIKVRNSSW